MAELFRKTSLEKLSSPEQLDKMIVITPPSFWIALTGIVVIIVSALAWSICGRLPVNVEAQGVYVNEGGTWSVYSEVSGIITEVVVSDGDTVSEGDVIAYVDDDAIEEKLEAYEERIRMVEAITITSTDDVVTADNKGLIDIKDQLLTVDQSLQQDLAMLSMRQESLTEQREKTNEAQQKLMEAEATYYDSLNVGDVTDVQLAYSEAQTAQSTAASYLESAYAGYDQADASYVQAQTAYLAAQSALEEAEKTVEELESSLSDTDGMTDSEITELQTALEEAQAAWEETQSVVNEYAAEMSSAQSSKDYYQTMIDKYAAEKTQADSDYNTARDNYISATGDTNTSQADSSIKSNEYSLALSEYNTEYSTLVSLEDTVAQLKVQVEADQDAVELQTQTIYSQFDATKASTISQLNMEMEEYQQQLEACALTATVSGRISDVAVVQGSAVSQGTELVKVQQGEEHVVVCYVSLSSGKRITEGMTVYVYPTTVSKQEYGHMEAVVESVDEYVSSTEELRTQLGNDTLVEAFLQDGPVMAVTCRLLTDENTESGYYWSSKKGASLSIAEGTLVEAGVVIEEKAPITMLIPYIKEKLTIKTADTDSN